MPKVRKLSEDEVLTIERKNKGQRRLVEEQYDIFLEGYNIGDYGEAELESEEKRITVRNRLKAASARRGMTLEFRRTKGDTLRFRVIGENGHAAHLSDDDDDDSSEAEAVSTEAPPVTPKRRGRRKKSESS